MTLGKEYVVDVDGFGEDLGEVFNCHMPRSLHGLWKAGATSLAKAGASECVIASYLAYKDTKLTSVYTRTANRAQLADGGFAKLSVLSNDSTALDNKRARLHANQ